MKILILNKTNAFRKTGYSNIVFSDYARSTSDGTAYVNNVAYDDNAYNFNFDSTFTWHGSTYASISGNSWIGVGSSSENIRMHRRDAKMYYLYVLYAKLTDINNMKAIKMSWRGASVYNGSLDRWWSLWLFENGDAMIYVSTTGSNTGTCDFYGQSYTAADDSFISFYYDSSTSTYNIKYEQYDIFHHIG